MHVTCYHCHIYLIVHVRFPYIYDMIFLFIDFSCFTLLNV